LGGYGVCFVLRSTIALLRCPRSPEHLVVKSEMAAQNAADQVRMGKFAIDDGTLVVLIFPVLHGIGRSELSLLTAAELIVRLIAAFGIPDAQFGRSAGHPLTERKQFFEVYYYDQNLRRGLWPAAQATPI
jgi:hypothetical protein